MTVNEHSVPLDEPLKVHMVASRRGGLHASSRGSNVSGQTCRIVDMVSLFWIFIGLEVITMNNTWQINCSETLPRWNYWNQWTIASINLLFIERLATWHNKNHLKHIAKHRWNEWLTVSETAMLTTLSRITGLSWSIISIIGLSSSCKAWSHSLHIQPSNLSSILLPDFLSLYLRLLDGHKETSYLSENGNGESAGAQLTGAQ